MNTHPDAECRPEAPTPTPSADPGCPPRRRVQPRATHPNLRVLDNRATTPSIKVRHPDLQRRDQPYRKKRETGIRHS